MKKSLSAAALAIANAIIWASVMIAAAATVDADAYGSLNGFLLAGWFMTHMLAVGSALDRETRQAEWRCLGSLTAPEGDCRNACPPVSLRNL